jgi:hypothetical protein
MFERSLKLSESKVHPVFGVVQAGDPLAEDGERTEVAVIVVNGPYGLLALLKNSRK